MRRAAPPLAELHAGAFAILPAALAACPFGLMLGQQAVAKGLTPMDVLAMSSIVFAGSAQFVAIGLWESPPPLLVLACTVLLINLRHVLMGASIAGRIRPFGPLRFVAVHLMADEIWAVAERRALSQPLTPAFWFGAGLLLFFCWQVSTVLGAVLGATIQDPARYGLDFAFPAMFLGLALSFWKGWRTGPVVAAAGITAVLAHAALPGGWHVPAGALAGIATAVVLGPEKARR
ncbi:AzlC family ABC transporter permease [Rhodovastum atsumiense]|nr:AzlC family ABC transporter permease [Rhodovastum atsumiense]CAH2601315.1 AzlC family ABC transporter permease [Rhodovastum atsumiense]